LAKWGPTVRGAYILYQPAPAPAALSNPIAADDLGQPARRPQDFRGGAGARPSPLRTERDLSMKVVVFGASRSSSRSAARRCMNVVGPS
jgi:hypothetical protein